MILDYFRFIIDIVLNNNYNNNTLEAVTQGSEVGGYPSKILSLLKTTLFLALSNNIFAGDFFNKAFDEIDGFNNNSFIKINYNRNAPETSEEARIRLEREQLEINDVKLNKAEIADRRYYVDKRWVSTKYTKPNTTEDLKDSDNDGYDDYFEFKNGTNPKDSSSFPAVRNGNNKIIFK